MKSYIGFDRVRSIMERFKARHSCIDVDTVMNEIVSCHDSILFGDADKANISITFQDGNIVDTVFISINHDKHNNSTTVMLTNKFSENGKNKILQKTLLFCDVEK